MSVVSLSTTQQDDASYQMFSALVARTFADAKQATMRPVMFTVTTNGLWDIYLRSIPAAMRQYYTCTDCRHFIQRFGGIVTILPDGTVKSAVWPNNQVFFSIGQLLKKEVESRPVSGIVVSNDDWLGVPQSNGWNHLSVLNKWRAGINPSQTADKFRRSYEAVVGLLGNGVRADTYQRLQEMLSTGNYSSLANATSIAMLKEAYRICKTAESIRHELRGNYTHLEAANAPDGWFTNSTLAMAVAERAQAEGFDTALGIYRRSSAPDKYQRTTAAPSAQAVQRAESWFADNGYQLSLRRKAAVLSDVPQAWSTSPLVADNVRDATALFASVKTRGTAKRRSQDYTGDHDIRYEDFMRRILPQARRMKLFVPAVARFGQFTDAVHREAPTLFRWNNGVAWYTYLTQTSASQWKLTPSTYCPVVAVCDMPYRWNNTPEEADRFADTFGYMRLIVLNGARDTINRSSALFPQTLKAELREHARTIEQYGQTHGLHDTPIYHQVVAGLLVSPGDRFTVRVEFDTSEATYKVG